MRSTATATDSMSEPYASDSDGKIYVLPSYFEMVYCRNLRTVRDWARRGLIRTLDRDGAMYVHLGDTRKMDRHAATQPDRKAPRRKAS